MFYGAIYQSASLHLIFFHFQNNLVQTTKDRRSAVLDPTPFSIKVRVLCLGLRIVKRRQQQQQQH